MPAVGITGGIATGKSAFAKALLRHLPGELFDADLAARELLERDPAIGEQVRAAFGDAVLLPDGSFDRGRLRAEIFADETKRHLLEAILHPAIRRKWTVAAARHAMSASWFFVDIPLLFETAAESCFERVVVVACSSATQRARLRDQRGVDDQLAEQMIGAQLDLEQKIVRADHLIWNDSTTECLEGQTALFAGWLRQRHG
jgi:dephospho-CoA kinase